MDASAFNHLPLGGFFISLLVAPLVTFALGIALGAWLF